MAVTRANQKGVAYTDGPEPPSVSTFSQYSFPEPTRPTQAGVPVATRVFRPEDGLNYASTLTTATVTV